jgi:MoxR-like ATPase
MTDMINRTYTGDGKRHYLPLPGAYDKPEPYRASDALRDAVNTALYLRRPLLLEGDPGCGKTRLAYSVAYELGLPLKAGYIRSTDRAQDLLYTYDAVGRLYDLQELRRANQKPAPRKKYVSLGILGEAIKLSQQDTPSVVLIDEIDKADIDFPNDLLLVLDRYQFNIPEAREPGREQSKEKVDEYDALRGGQIKDRQPYLPLVIITSNREKELPKPFLRRCVFFYIPFPNEKELKLIIESHFDEGVTPLAEAALAQFNKMRTLKSLRWRKIPSTSELLDWLMLLRRDERDKKIVAHGNADDPHAAIQYLPQSEAGAYIANLLKESPPSGLPYLSALVKTQGDLDALAKA